MVDVLVEGFTEQCLSVELELCRQPSGKQSKSRTARGKKSTAKAAALSSDQKPSGTHEAVYAHCKLTLNTSVIHDM